MQDLQGLNIPTRTLADYVCYGKVFGQFGKAWGIFDIRVKEIEIKIEEPLLIVCKKEMRIWQTFSMASIESLSTTTLSTPTQYITSPSEKLGLIIGRSRKNNIRIKA